MIHLNLVVFGQSSNSPLSQKILQWVDLKSIKNSKQSKREVAHILQNNDKLDSLAVGECVHAPTPFSLEIHKIFKNKMLWKYFE